MRTRVFGSTGRQVAVVGQGTWHMERDDRTEAVRALRRGLDLGMAHIDTAELYVARRHAARVRALARAPPDRPARRLPPPLARLASARGDDRRVRGARGGREDPRVGRVE